MIVMPANSSGWFWHCLARETGRLGHLFSPGSQRGPWPWFPYAMDNGAFACWDQRANAFDDQKWESTESQRHRLVVWSQAAPIRPMWAIVPDVPGNGPRTIDRWKEYAPRLLNVSRALAVQDGMEIDEILGLSPAPDVIAVGGTTEWKWHTVESWARAFARVHLLRCNSPERLYELEAMGIESTDGTGWSRGDRKQTEGLERWARFTSCARDTAALAARLSPTENTTTGVIRMKTTIAKTFDFDAAHSLGFLPEGHKCRRLHGHTYRVEIRLTGYTDEHGMLVDYQRIADAWAPVCEKLDHHNRMTFSPVRSARQQRPWPP